MNRFFRYFGILSFVALIIYGSTELYDRFPAIINSALRIVGLLTIVIVVIRVILGRQWIRKLATEFFIGNDLIKATENYLADLPNPTKESTANLVGQLVYRFTRLGLIGLVLAIIPAWLLYQQNQLFGYQNEKVTEQTVLIRKQTDLLDSQDKRFETQNKLIEGQNERIDTQSNLLKNQNYLVLDQNSLSRDQNLLVGAQNIRIDSQITLMGVQNDRLNLQNNLIEAERRSSLIFLMSNVLDKVDDEIREQRQALPKDSLGNTSDSIKFKLSKPLISRIVGLSRAFRPYKMLEGDALSNELVSPERGQLFIALMENNLDSLTQSTIVQSGNFSNAVIGRINLRDAILRDANLIGADLRFANLRFANLRFANLAVADLSSANFGRADLSRADLSYADLRRANFGGADLSRADLRRANFGQADLGGADLSYAYLRSANFGRADLRGADLREAYLSGADLSFADLRGIINLTFEQLIAAKSLYRIRNLSVELRQQLEKEKPCLFENPSGSKACPE